MYAPPAFPDLSRPEERRRLSPAALRAFFNIVERWSLREEDARQLLGGISSGAYYEFKKKPNRLLDQDRLQRISYLIGIFKALNILYGTRLADSWVQLANTNPLFSGRTPLHYMLQRGTPGMEVVRSLLDSRRG
jgi:Protein of unknown function (DUF2384)